MDAIASLCHTVSTEAQAKRGSDVQRRIGAPRSSAPLALAAALIGGCGTDLGQVAGLSPVSGYQASNAFSPVGHSIAATGTDSIRVTAVATSSTPPERVEKIALARAAEYGAELHKKSFTASPAQHSVRCGKTSYLEKGTKVPMRPADYRVVDIDVVYADTPPAPAARSPRDAVDALKAELASEAVPFETQQALAAEITRQCGR